MLGQIWLDEAIGSGAEHPGSPRQGEAGGISSVVQAFLRNDAGFSREDVAGYINVALQNEAAELWRDRAESLEVIGLWQRHADQGTGGFEDIETTEAELRLHVMHREESEHYNRGRTGFGEAVLLARDSGQVSLVLETCGWVTRLDHDGHLTGSMGLDVASVFGAAHDCAVLLDFFLEVHARSGTSTARWSEVQGLRHQYVPVDAGDATGYEVPAPEVA